MKAAVTLKKPSRPPEAKKRKPFGRFLKDKHKMKLMLFLLPVLKKSL
jgi:hypothetical protein